MCPAKTCYTVIPTAVLAWQGRGRTDLVWKVRVSGFDPVTAYPDGVLFRVILNPSRFWGGVSN